MEHRGIGIGLYTYQCLDSVMLHECSNFFYHPGCESIVFLSSCHYELSSVLDKDVALSLVWKDLEKLVGANFEMGMHFIGVNSSIFT